jgi:dihydroxy-acid dehydratase
MMPSDYEGERPGFVRGQTIVQEKLQQSANAPNALEDLQEIMQEITDGCATSAGSCNELTTGNTLAVLTEGMGIALPGSSTSPSVSAEKIWQAKETGEKILELVRRNIRPRDVITLNSLKNAVAVDMATCGGTNSGVRASRTRCLSSPAPKALPGRRWLSTPPDWSAPRPGP